MSREGEEMSFQLGVRWDRNIADDPAGDQHLAFCSNFDIEITPACLFRAKIAIYFARVQRCDWTKQLFVMTYKEMLTLR